MKKIDVVRPGTLKKSIGPSGTLKRIIKNREYFLSRGYDVTIFTHDVFSEESESNETPTITHTQKSFLYKLKSRLREYAKHSSWFGAVYIIRDYLNVKKLTLHYLKQNRIVDAVVFHSTFECYQFLRRNKRPVKTVLFFHSDGIPLKMEKIYYPKMADSCVFRKLHQMEEYVIKNVDQLVFISEIGRNNFLSYYPFIDKNKTIVILNGIEDLTDKEQRTLEEHIQSQEKFAYRLCCTGTINARKGQSIIVEALHRLDPSILKDIHLTLIGNGPDKFLLEQLVEKYGLPEHVSFVGNVPNDQVYLYLSRATIYILMSYNEGLPISIIEAMRMELPIISTRISGIPELVPEGVNGFLVEPDIDQLVSILEHIKEYDWAAMGEQSREIFINKFTFDRMKSEYCNMLDHILN